ncbi:MAG: putative ABC transporter permease [Clostridia bacterium]|nr:putative ABC transporter permease [Clostridia bacterium]
MKFVDFLKKARNLIEWFIIYCIMGWLYEVVWWYLIELNRGFVNRGVLYGPWLPIYGFGMLAVLGVVRLLKIKKPFPIFLIGTALVTGVELLGSYIMEWTVGYIMWDYSGMFGNYDGRIAVKTSILFGLLIMFGIYSVHPRMEKFQKRFDNNVIHNILFVLVLITMIADAVFTFFIK